MADFQNDDELIEALREHAKRTDPVPAHVLLDARAALDLRRFDEELADLLRDSALEDKELAGVRGVGQRLLTFGAGDVFIEVDVAMEQASACTLTGYVVPSGTGELTLELPDDSRPATLDGQGRFRIERVPHGPVRLRFAVPGVRQLITPWTVGEESKELSCIAIIPLR